MGDEYIDKIYNNEMVYDDAKSIGIDGDSLKQLMNILTPRMQKQLVDSFHNNSEVKQWAVNLLTTHLQILQFVTTTCYT